MTVVYHRSPENTISFQQRNQFLLTVRFLFEGTRSKAASAFRQISTIAEPGIDDIRIYRLKQCGHVHLGHTLFPDDVMLLGRQQAPFPGMTLEKAPHT